MVVVVTSDAALEYYCCCAPLQTRDMFPRPLFSPLFLPFFSPPGSFFLLYELARTRQICGVYHMIYFANLCLLSLPAAKVHFKEKAWVRASEASRHFVRSLLLKSPHLRLTTAGAQKHEWLRGAEDLSQTPQQDARFREEVTQSMLNFR